MDPVEVPPARTRADLHGDFPGVGECLQGRLDSAFRDVRPLRQGGDGGPRLTLFVGVVGEGEQYQPV